MSTNESRGCWQSPALLQAEAERRRQARLEIEAAERREEQDQNDLILGRTTNGRITPATVEAGQAELRPSARP